MAITTLPGPSSDGGPSGSSCRLLRDATGVPASVATTGKIQLRKAGQTVKTRQCLPMRARG